MTKQYMSIRNKQYRGPQKPHIVSNGKIKHAHQRGASAFTNHGKSIVDNPYNPGALHEAWKKGFVEASGYNYTPIKNKAPEGKGRHLDGYVVVKRYGATKNLKGDYVAPEKEKEMERYLGYIKPGRDGKLRRFFVWTNNPPEDKWQNKIACKSYKPEKKAE